MTAATLPLDETDAVARRVDHLYLALTAGKPLGGSRWSLAGMDRVELGRGAIRAVRYEGRTMIVEVPDPWMSAHHLRFERERATWIAVDAGSRNGFLVNGTKQERAAVLDHDVIEAGRSFFMLRMNELADAAMLDVDRAPSDSLVTLDPALAHQLDQLRRAAASAIPILIGGATGSGKERRANGARRVATSRSVRRGATHHDLDALVEAGKFREDLVARLAGFELTLPALTERRPDLGLVRQQVQRWLKRYGLDPARYR